MDEAHADRNSENGTDCETETDNVKKRGGAEIKSVGADNGGDADCHEIVRAIFKSSTC